MGGWLLRHCHPVSGAARGHARRGQEEAIAGRPIHDHWMNSPSAYNPLFACDDCHLCRSIDRCSTTSGTKTSNTRCDTPKWHPIGSKTSGGNRDLPHPNSQNTSNCSTRTKSTPRQRPSRCIKAIPPSFTLNKAKVHARPEQGNGPAADGASFSLTPNLLECGRSRFFLPVPRQVGAWGIVPPAFITRIRQLCACRGPFPAHIFAAGDPTGWLSM
jgi:hypothetical protein